MERAPPRGSAERRGRHGKDPGGNFRIVSIQAMESLADHLEFPLHGPAVLAIVLVLGERAADAPFLDAAAGRDGVKQQFLRPVVHTNGSKMLGSMV